MLPEATIKRLADCSPTELVRPHFRGPDSLAFVSSYQTKCFLVLLTGAGFKEPTYLRVNEPATLHVLSYGNSYDLRLDHLKDLEVGVTPRWGQAGSIILGETSKLLVARSDSGLRDTGFYDLETGQLVESTDRSTVSAFRWDLRLQTADAEFSPILFAFRAPQQD